MPVHDRLCDRKWVQKWVQIQEKWVQIVLTDSRVNSVRKKDKPYRMNDGNGLYLNVSRSGTKSWRVRYKFNSKESMIVIGHYPSMSLADARSAALDVRNGIREGRNPNTDKLLKKELAISNYENTLEVVARKWWDTKKALWSKKHAKDVIRSLERDVFPYLGGIPITELTPQIILKNLQDIEKRGAIETAHRIRQRLDGIFVHAIASGICKDNPASIIGPALLPITRGKQPAIINFDEAVGMINQIDKIPAYPVTKLAMRFLILTAVRSSELRFTRWSEFENLEGENPVWRIPKERMKGEKDKKREHIVPLSRQAVEVINLVRQFSCHLEYVFPNYRHSSKAMSENALGYLINRAGYYQRHVPHGFRTLFSTIMNERFPQDRFVIDLALSHINPNKVEGSYNRTTHFDRRKILMQEWADIITRDLRNADELVAVR